MRSAPRIVTMLPMNNAPVRIAIIGSGGITHAHASGILKYSDKLKCVALCDVSQENLKNRNEQLGGNCRPFTD
jgi:UDP-N-acetyl-2-amino-2-deoxyglucuronate dehydrogenase